jgi:hypothetical protein
MIGLGRGASSLRAKRVGRGTTRRVVEGYAAQAFAISRLNLQDGASYPSTMLRMVPLPISDGED